MAEDGREERLKELRERLYSRGSVPPKRERRELKDTKEEVKTSWNTEARPAPAPKPAPAAPAPKQAPKAAPVPPTRPQQTAETQVPRPSTPPAPTPVPDTMPTKKPKRFKYRLKLIVAGLVFFIGALAVSSLFLILGQNTISGSNISIDVSGPFAIGGGEELSLQIAIANQNNVPVESATLIIEYPPGTQSADEPGKELFRERTQLPNIKSGEIINVPARAIIFGEENDERSVSVSVEYRVAGSNATFFKEAEPLRFKISSSPVVLAVENITEVTSGQEVEFEIEVSSNSPSPVSNILVTAEYPFGFDYEESDPSPVAGQNTWRIDELQPEESQIITVKGIVVGDQSDERVFRFSVGVPNERDAFSLASVFSTASTEIEVTEAFLGIDMVINGDNSSTVAIGSGDRASVSLTFQNTLSRTIYDGEIEVLLGGNALAEDQIDARDGFYNSSNNTISWTQSQVRSLAEIAPGDSHTVTFSLEPSEGIDSSRTPQITLAVNMRGKRVSEDRVPEQLVESVTRTIRFESVIELSSQAVYSIGPFVNTGPTPPVAEKVTQYTFVLETRNGSNDVTDTAVSATLPPSVTWLDLVSAGDTITYNPASREISWDVGDLDAHETDSASFQISFLPSITQVGSVPTILGTQRLRATDRFTGTVLRADAPALTTRLLADPDEDVRDGRVQEDD